MSKQQNNKPVQERATRPGLVGWFDNFSGDHEWRTFSNFHQDELVVLDVTWGVLADAWAWDRDILASWLEDGDLERLVCAPTGEHLFAAFKTKDMFDFLNVLVQPTPGKAKGLGREIKLRPDWEQVKYDAMLVVLRAKFKLNRPEGQRLLMSGDALLVEGTHWGDKVWGVALNKDDDPLASPGRNWLGMLLMVRRAELVAEAQYGHVGQQAISSLAFVLR